MEDESVGSFLCVKNIVKLWNTVYLKSKRVFRGLMSAGTENENFILGSEL
jgi:acyl-[acyl carrier protein]--UDP-N-acetylglucosamine O-acyltransferase